MCEEAEKELAWESEKKAVLLHKLRATYLEAVAMERVELRGLEQNILVSTFPLNSLSAPVQRELQEIKSQYVEEFFKY
jgi:hypothetical protein